MNSNSLGKFIQKNYLDNSGEVVICKSVKYFMLFAELLILEKHLYGKDGFIQKFKFVKKEHLLIFNN